MTGSSISERLLANPYGITEVYRSENPVVDIVFVHGLNGSPFSTWATQDTQFFWPAELLPRTLHDLPIRVLMFGYNATVATFMDGASKDRLHNHAEHLAGHLSANRNFPTNNATERPIIFVCHSLGGLVVKKTLIYCSQLKNEKLEHLRSIFVSTYGILFLGTPHNGSDVAKFGGILQSISRAVIPKKILDSSEQLLNVLKTNNEHLQNINRDFANIMNRFDIYFFHESKPLDMKGTRAFIVDETSAAPTLDGVERLGIEADHSAMCRFRNENSAGYGAVKEAIFRYSTKALQPTNIPSRWEEERGRRMSELAAEKKRIVYRMGGSPEQESDLNPEPQREPEKRESIEPKEPLFVLPPGFHPNSAFYGMQNELGQLHTRLSKVKKRSQGSVAVLLYAGPGAGKSYLARQYMYEYQRLYPGGIFWVDAKTPQSRANGYWHIAHAASELEEEKQSPDPNWLSHDKYVGKVRRWLESRDDWLLIFDGITFDDDSEITEFKKYLPFRPNTSIIYTSVDRTLSKKSRLFEPYGLHVKPLAVSEAKTFLFRELGIKHPSAAQDEKATHLVKHYERLPLAIHAISHRLVANGKALEKYDIESHLTDQQLAKPYQDIIKDLRSQGYKEALNMINILSFFGHHIPVGMVLLGRRALTEANLEIRSLDREGSSDRHIDNTLAILIRYGLIERTLDSDILSDHSSGSSIGRTSSGHSRTSPESEKMVFISPARSSIDMIKVHTVVQGFCRDELKVQNPGNFYSWLGVATALFCSSYAEANARIKATRDPGHVRDYREYQIHARRLIRHFPTKLSRRAIDLRPMKQRLLELAGDIEKEVESRSPSSSQESVRNQKSIFDTANSMSTEPSTPASDLSQTGWSSDIGYESPEQAMFPPMPEVRRPPLPVVQIPDQPNSDYGIESPTSTNQTLSPSLTEVPSTDNPDNDGDEGWHKVPEKKKIPEKKTPLWSWKPRLPWKGGRGRKDLGEFRPAAAPILTNVHGTGSSLPQKEPVERHSLTSLHSQSPAESLLANIGHSSPPPSRGGSIRSPSRVKAPVDGRPTYATVARKHPSEKLPDRRPSPLSSGPQFPEAVASQTIPDHRPMYHPAMEIPRDPMSQSACSDPGAALSGFQSPGMEFAPRPYSRTHQPQWPPRVSNLRDEYGSYGSADANILPMPYAANIPITRRQPPHTYKASNGAYNQGLAPPFRAEMPYSNVPYGYESQPLSRGPSHQSTQSLHTEPGRFPPRFSPGPMKSDPYLHKRTASLTNMQPGGSPMVDPWSVHEMKFAQGDSHANSEIDSPIVGAQPMSRGSSGPGIIVADGSVVEFGAPVGGSGNIQFGEQAPISLEEARQRTEQYERWLASHDGYSTISRHRGQVPYPRHNLMPTSSHSGEIESMLAQPTVGDRPRRAYPYRTRSGSSPTRSTFYGLGLHGNLG